MKMFSRITMSAVLALPVAGIAHADVLDDVLQRGSVRCAVVLDYPPIGFRTADNKPAGFDVDYCEDLAKALGVTAEVVEVTWPERIPALISGKVDVAVASASDTLERAKTVGFSIPYRVDTYQIMQHKGAGLRTYDDLKTKRVGAVIGNTQETNFLAYKEKVWGDGFTGTYTSFQNENEAYVALEQGQVDAIVVTAIAVHNLLESGKYPDTEAGPMTPYLPDVVSMMTIRQEYGWLNYLNLFINQQVRTGRFDEVYKKWIGGEIPKLTIDRVYY
ncbi:MAG: transporter substrate-binding domain-containing protein [Mesorhizobium sp.]|nr:MAG: transporter substrate-binding domain-containing protein [Mesorhizobium sp.]RWC66419.1 MAG: transporter substrate-binding domain-containing protein [Mesorhizobium sp.]